MTDTVQTEGCQKIDCCTTTVDGHAVCAVSQPVSPKFSASQGNVNIKPKRRASIMFGIACIASPCCTPLIIPMVLSLLAGTPLALWLGQNLGWVYGSLTLLSVVSFLLAFRWMYRAPSLQTDVIHLVDISIIKPNRGEKNYANSE